MNLDFRGSKNNHIVDSDYGILIVFSGMFFIGFAMGYTTAKMVDCIREIC